MKEYKIDVPVMLYVFIRPETLQEVFNVLKQARPSVLFFVSDGPRENVKTDEINIQKCRKIVEDIDWNCKVYKLYSEKNMGMYQTGINAREFVFNKVDRCIFLEDDTVPNVSFFKYCAELLEKYKDDLRIHRICGTNTLGIYDEPNSDYFFSQEGSIWGFATWKRVYEHFDYNHSFGNDEYIMTKLKENSHPSWYKRYYKYGNGRKADGHVAGPEFFYQSMCELQNSLNIVPSKNLISNIGVVNGSTHSADNINKLPLGIQRVFNMKTHEIIFPLRHPSYVIQDKQYYKKVNRIFAMGHPVVLLYRKIETFIRYLFMGDFRGVIFKIKRKIRNYSGS